MKKTTKILAFVVVIFAEAFAEAITPIQFAEDCEAITNGLFKPTSVPYGHYDPSGFIISLKSRPDRIPDDFSAELVLIAEMGRNSTNEFDRANRRTCINLLGYHGTTNCYEMLARVLKDSADPCFEEATRSYVRLSQADPDMLVPVRMAMSTTNLVYSRTVQRAVDQTVQVFLFGFDSTNSAHQNCLTFFKERMSSETYGAASLDKRLAWFDPAWPTNPVRLAAAQRILANDPSPWDLVYFSKITNEWHLGEALLGKELLHSDGGDLPPPVE